MKRLFPIIALLSLAYLAGCVTLPTSTSTEPRHVEAPPRYVLGQVETPDDIKLVTAAIIYRLRGVDGMVEHVSFNPDGFVQVGEEGFNYEGFEMVSMTITGYEETVLEANKKTSVTLEGVLLFKDEFLRRAGVYFAATYTATAKGIVIENAFANGIPPEGPEVQAFMVPAKAVQAADPEVMRGYLPLYLFAIENAIPMAFPEGQRKVYSEGEYFMMIFTKDRIFDDSDMQMRVSTSRSLGGTQLTSPIYIGENGWRIMIAGGKFSPGSSANRFYFGVEYTANPGPEIEPIQLALFSNKITTIEPNQPRATTAQPAAMEPVQMEAAPQATAGDGPIAQGKIFLNPIMKQDAKAIQARLKELGHYNGTVDGAFGKNSKNALDSYAASQGLSSSAWTLMLQKQLFAGSGQ